MTRYLGRQRAALFQRGAFYAAPALLTALLLTAVGLIAWDRLSAYQIRSKLAELGLTVTSTEDGLAAEANTHLTGESFARSGPLLIKLSAIRTLNLARNNVENFKPLEGLTALRELTLDQSIPAAELTRFKGSRQEKGLQPVTISQN